MTGLPTEVKGLVDRLAEGGGDETIYLDPTDAGERAAIEYFLDRSGKGADRYPALHAAIADGGAAVPDAPLDRCVLVDAGEAADGTATARTWVGSSGRAMISGAHTLLLDRDSGEELASGTSTQVGGGLVRNHTEAEARAATPRMLGISFFHAQRAADRPARFGLSAEPVTLVAKDPTVTVSEPRYVRGETSGPVVIGIARQRGWQNTDCDYIYPSAANVEPDRLVVPFAGTAEFENEIKLPLRDLRTYLWCEGLPLNGLQAQSALEARFKVEANNKKKLTWDFSFDDQPINNTRSLQYQPLAEADENEAGFYFRFQILEANNTLQTVVLCSSEWPERPSKGCTSVLNLKYWWHCLQADAQVTLADGTRRELEAIDNTTEVRLMTGGTAVIQATTLEVPDLDPDGEDPVYELVTAGGRSLILSAMHPVFVSGNPVMARDLQAGQQIAVEGGVDSVTSCQPLVTFQGRLGNLQLAGTGPLGFFANGIAVGDFDTMVDHRQQTRHDPDYMLARLPESQHQDFLSALADS